MIEIIIEEMIFAMSLLSKMDIQVIEFSVKLPNGELITIK